MDAVKFLEMFNTMCERHIDTCKNCPLEDRAICSLNDLDTHESRVAVVDAVREWGEQHGKTIGSDIEKALPAGAEIKFGDYSVTVIVPIEDWDKVVYTDVEQDI